MKKILRGFVGLATGLVVISGVFAEATPVFANNRVSSNYSRDTSKIEGQIDLSKVVYNNGRELVKNGKRIYEGNVGGAVEASDLFEGAYNKFVADFKNKREWLTGKRYENLVMFDYNKQYPSVKYTVTFPKNFVIDEKNITATENTVTIGKIEKSYDKASNSVTFRLFLGSWNDYKGFFELYEKERGSIGHLININIPYSVEVTNSSITTLGKISSSGKCELYKYGGIFGYNKKIVNINTKPISLNVIK